MAIKRHNGSSENRILVGLSKIYRKSLNTLYIIRLQFECSRVRSKGQPIAFILGTPDHENLGDQAIAQAELAFFPSYEIPASPISVPTSLITNDNHLRLMFRLVRKADILYCHGGGNLGETYMQEEDCRRKIIEGFPDNKIIIFPQTIHFSDNLLGKEELQKTIAVYSKHKNLTLIGREQISYKKMIHDFPKNKILLTPDIVLSMNHSTVSLPRKGALLCLRADVEQNLDNTDRQKIETLCQKRFGHITWTDTVTDAKLFALRLKKNALAKKLREFQEAEFVITDRLHGMVFAAITGTPCIALANYNHKVAGTYEWIKNLSYIKFCNEVSELSSLLEQVDMGQSHKYDPTKYNDYWHKIRAIAIN